MIKRNRFHNSYATLKMWFLPFCFCCEKSEKTEKLVKEIINNKDEAKKTLSDILKDKVRERIRQNN